MSKPSSVRLVPLLLAGALVRCDCEETQEFRPSGLYDPESVLDFGIVSVRAEKTLPIRVTSVGQAALIIDSLATILTPPSRDARATPDLGVFRVDVDPELASLAPGRSSTISVTYRPCPQLWEGGWEGNRLKTPIDDSVCQDGAVQAKLSIIDNTREGKTEIQVSGRPGQSPKLALACAPGAGHCGEDGDLSGVNGCTSLVFGDVNAGATPCDLTVEIRNEKRNGKDTGDLVIERLDVLVFSLDDPNQTLRVGSEVGFSLLDEAGQPLVVNSDQPLVVPIPVGQPEGRKRIKVRFAGSSPGFWAGTAETDGGLRLYSNDPDHQPVTSLLLTANGTAPDIKVQHPGKIDFGSVQQGTTATGAAIIKNDGNAPLIVSDVRMRGASGAFSVTTSRGNSFTLDPLGGPNNTASVQVTYAPSGSGYDADQVVVSSNDVDTPQLAIPVSGGAVPQIDVQPNPTVVFPLPAQPDGQPRTQQIEIANVGFGDLQIQRFEIVGPAPEENRDHSSVNDFTIQGCSGNPCDQAVTLCAPGSPGCQQSSKTFTIVYANDDASQTDLVSLLITSNDPVNRVWRTVLSAEDVPCLFPTPAITVETSSIDRKVGSPIIISAAGSTVGSGTSIVDHRWAFAFAPAAFPALTEVVAGDSSRMTFTPATTGLYILQLNVTNDCGAASQRAATERINIAPE